MGAAATEVVVLPVARARAASRALVCSVPAFLLGITTILIFGRLNFNPSGVSNRLVDYSMAAISLPIPLIAAWTALKALRWLLLALWPARVAVVAEVDSLTLRLGPFGTRAYDTPRLDIRYLFELSQDADGGGFEAFLPEDEQRAKLLPRILHPAAREPLHRVILRFVKESEPDAARTLRPLIDRWRSGQLVAPRL
ncbi:MAG: hypothetical protein AAB363_03870 [Planctomycetota bacterium]